MATVATIITLCKIAAIPTAKTAKNNYFKMCACGHKKSNGLKIRVSLPLRGRSIGTVPIILKKTDSLCAVQRKIVLF